MREITIKLNLDDIGGVNSVFIVDDDVYDSNEKIFNEFKEYYINKNGIINKQKVAKKFNISRTTIYNWIKRI